LYICCSLCLCGIVHFLRDNVSAGCPGWQNNGCESLNHVLKRCVQWRPNKLPVCRRRPGSPGLWRFRPKTPVCTTSLHSAGLGPHDSLPEEQGSGTLLPATSAQQCCHVDGRQADRQQCTKRRSQTASAEAFSCRPDADGVEAESTDRSLSIFCGPK